MLHRHLRNVGYRWLPTFVCYNPELTLRRGLECISVTVEIYLRSCQQLQLILWSRLLRIRTTLIIQRSTSSNYGCWDLSKTARIFLGYGALLFGAIRRVTSTRRSPTS